MLFDLELPTGKNPNNPTCSPSESDVTPIYPVEPIAPCVIVLSDSTVSKA